MSYAFDTALAELGEVAGRIDPAAMVTACTAICDANRIVLYGCGREGLQLRGFAMRLHHLGLRAAVQGDMTAPPVGKGDLLVVSDGPGRLSTVAALAGIARDAGARVLLLTAEPAAPIALKADHVLTIPAQTMARDRGAAATSTLPMGSLYEGALFLLFEVMVLRLRDMTGATPDDMRARHTNLGVDYFTAPAAIPLMMNRSSAMPMMISGRIAAKLSAAIDHQLMPCEPVWLATITGSVLAWLEVRSAAKKYSFQVRISDRMKDATMPGAAMGSTMVRKAPQIESPSTSAASSSSVGMEPNWSRMIQMTIGSTVRV